MKRIRRISGWVALLLSISINSLYGHGLSTHIAIGEGTYSAWLNFDRQFYDSITKTPGSPREVMSLMRLKKFYYIGLTLPDMFYEQTTICSLIGKLYRYNLILDGPVEITDTTYNSTRTLITDDRYRFHNVQN